MFAVKRLIDSVWTLEFTLSSKGATIHQYSRDLSVGYEREDELPKCKLQEAEGEGRIVEAIIVDGVQHKVLNPQNIFSYGR